MTPYYERAGVTIFHTDARELLPTLTERFDAVVTDPVWPNAVASLAGSDDPAWLFAQVAVHFPRLAERVVVQLGCDSDPRFLRGMPAELPYLRTCWLEYAQPGYKGRVLYSGDVAYVFGVPPPVSEAGRLMPGRMTATAHGRRDRRHPCEREIQHVRWLIKHFCRGPVLDPFCGTGTTLLAAKQLGLTAVGCEVEESFCEVAADRLRQDLLGLEVVL